MTCDVFRGTLNLAELSGGMGCSTYIIVMQCI